MSKHYFGVDLFQRTHLLSEIFVQIFAHSEFLRENVRRLVRARISMNKVDSERPAPELGNVGCRQFLNESWENVCIAMNPRGMEAHFRGIAQWSSWKGSQPQRTRLYIMKKVREDTHQVSSSRGVSQIQDHIIPQSYAGLEGYMITQNRMSSVTLI